MVMRQPCRAALSRSRQAYHLATSRACYATDATPVPESSSQSSEASTTQNLPRWSQTPQGLKAPIQMDRAKHPHNKVWSVNSSPEVLDEVFNKLLGPGGSKMLPEELKWLAVTHKSFDNGKRGFNDRLALLGRHALAMETTKSIVSKEPMPGSRIEDEFRNERQPFQHEALSPVDNLSVEGHRDVAGKEKLYALAADVGLLKALRWKPRMPRKLEQSGVETVMNSGILAIIGALTLQHGSAATSKVIRDRLLPRLRQF